MDFIYWYVLFMWRYVPAEMLWALWGDFWPL